MPEEDRTSLIEALDELCQAVEATGGAALYLDDDEGTLQLAATATRYGVRPPSLVQRLRGRVDDAEGDECTLIVRVPGANPGVVVLHRRSGGPFTQQDRTVAHLYVRRLTDDGAIASPQLGRSGWTRQLEAIQRIAARLTRLASIEEVGATICLETREVIDHDEAHVLMADNEGSFQRVAATGATSSDVVVPALPASGRAAETIARAAQGGMPVLTADLADLGEGRPGPHSMLVVPLHYESRVSGVICLIARGPQRFDDDDLRLLQILSDQAAVAIENARLLRGRDDLVQELAGLLEISQAAGSASDEAQLARLLAARMRVATATDAALVSRWDEGSTMLRVICRDGVGGDSTGIDVADSPARRTALREGRPQVVQADSTLAGVEAAQLRENGARTLILFPLNAGGRTIGLIELLATRSPRVLGEAELQACEAMASLAATGLEKVRLVEQLRSAADIDLVTGVHNHRYLQERLRQEVARSARSHSPLAVLMLDLDKFKPINDRHGHADGDGVLHGIGATIMAQVRTNDVVARYGGDEFIVLMPDTPEERAEQVARRVVSGILQRRHVLSDGSIVSVGASAGLAVYPADGRTSAQLLQAADAAMYSAKRSGGRQVERSSPTPKMETVPATAPAMG